MTRLRQRLDMNAEDPILALILLALGFLAGCAVGIVLGFALARYGYFAVAVMLALCVTGFAALMVAMR